MLETMYNGGRIALLGIAPTPAQIDWDQVVFRGLTIKGIYGREIWETWYKMQTMLQSGLDIAPVITHELPFEEYEARLRGDGRAGRAARSCSTWRRPTSHGRRPGRRAAGREG